MLCVVRDKTKVDVETKIHITIESTQAVLQFYRVRAAQ